MKKILLALAIILIKSVIHAQPCLSDGITFSSQEEIDNFQINYTGCTEIEGDVTIFGEDITNLYGLNVITAIDGFLKIDSAVSLLSLTGLENLTSVGDDLIIGDAWDYKNANLTSIAALGNVTYVGGNIWIKYNDSLGSLAGLENITSINGNLWINSNNSLLNLNGLNHLNTVNGWVWIYGNDFLLNLSGLDSLQTVGDIFSVQSCNSLQTIQELGNLTNIGGALKIHHNNSLINLTGLEGIIHIENDIFLYDNSILSNIIGLNNLSTVGGDLTISYCQDLENLIGLNNLNYVGGKLYLNGNYSMINLQGLNNLSYIGQGFITFSSGISHLQDLSSLSYIGGSIAIELTNLTTLEGLESVNLSDVGSLGLVNNSLLSECDIQSICDLLPSLGNYMIFNNAPGCDNYWEIAEGCEHCFPDGITLSLQEHIDSFQFNYPNCKRIDGDLIIGGDDITNLDGINMLKEVGGDLWILYNVILNDLSGLNNLYKVNGNLFIHQNEILSSLLGLDNIQSGSINDIGIINNPQLSHCHVQTICEYLASPNGIVEIHDNALGCNTLEEVEYTCWSDTEEYKNSDNWININPNPSSNEIYITYSNGSKIKEVKIYNKLGQVVYNEKEYSGLIDVSKFKSGMFIVEVITEDGRIKEKLIIQ